MNIDPEYERLIREFESHGHDPSTLTKTERFLFHKIVDLIGEIACLTDRVRELEGDHGFDCECSACTAHGYY